MIETFISFKDEILSVCSKVSHWSKYQWYRIFTNKSPLTEEEAKQHAYGVLSGDIKEAISFRNIDEKRIFILVHLHEKDQPYYKLVLLKQFGRSYTIDWMKEQVLLITELDVEDLQNKGIQNIIFIEESFGTGAGAKILNIINSQNKDHIKITEWFDWMQHQKPSSPEIEIEPHDLDKKFLAKIEDIAVKRGMLFGNPVDITKPEHAIQYWHVLNGNPKDGEIKLKLYSGKPNYESEPSEIADTEELQWISYFKGPLYGYLKSKDKHFIAYSPSNIYSWPQELKAMGNKVRFKSSSEKKYLTFELNDDIGILS